MKGRGFDGRGLSWALAAALALRLLGLCWGLPHTYNADEPYVVNLAVSFGGGSLKPYAFKYPTLWPYFLFLCYGVYFLLWSGFGLRRKVIEFVGLYAWNPTGFYLIARLWAAALSILALVWLWRAEKELRGAKDGPPWAAWLMAVAPVLVEAAHSAKPDCAMFFFAALAWLFGLRALLRGLRRDHLLCGVFCGLALSCQYTAAPLMLLPVLAWALGKKRAPAWWPLAALACAGAAFLAGSPYVVLDFSRFKDSIQDLLALKNLRPLDRAAIFSAVLRNIASFAGSGSAAAVFSLVGLGALWRRRQARAALFLALPVLGYVALLAGNPDGGWPRYLLGAFPGLALLSAEGLSFFDRPKRPLVSVLLAALVLVPGAALSLSMDLVMRRPDTRQLAQDWVEAEIPEGKTLLLDLPHAEPRLVMTKDELLELARRTRAHGSPRARLYEGMAATQPGGGYRILRLTRSAADLYSEPEHVARSQADEPMLDVSSGLAPARKAGVDYVITSSFGATPERSPELARFFTELQEQGKLEASFVPVPGRSSGPVLRVYRLR